MIEQDQADGDEVRMMLRESARQFASSRLGMKRLRETPSGATSRQGWAELTELGWSGMLVSNEYGGSGLGLQEMVEVLEELGKVAATEPLTACGVIAATIIQGSDNAELRGVLASDLATGGLLPAVGTPAPSKGGEQTKGTARSERADGGWRLRIQKHLVRPGIDWDGAIVPAHGGDGVSLFWIPRDHQGIRTEPISLADGSAAALVDFDDLVDERFRLCSPVAAPESIAQAVDLGRIACAAELLGVIRGSLRLGFEHLKTRRQFGVPIGSFQALRHRAVDLFLQQELVAASLDEGCRRIVGGCSAVERAAIAARLKARASEAALKVAKETIQFHGAMGYTDECDAGLFLKRAVVLAAWLGNASELRSAFAGGALKSVETTEGQGK